MVSSLTLARILPSRCPVCATPADGVRVHTREAAAQHFVPRSRDPRRHEELSALLADLWGRDEVQVRRCPTCGLSFADPFVSGDEGFYNLVSGSDPRYPSRRWEFGRTLASLRALYAETSRQVRLVELGAGDGAFLKGLRGAELGPRFEMLAIDYDAGAVERLERSGFTTYTGSLADLAHERPGSFDVVCLFQTLEHISEIETLFASISRLITAQGHVFLSTPNADATEVQEQLTGFWDMPPNHVARWTRSAFERIAEAHGLSLLEWELEHPYRLRTARELARFRLLAGAYDETSLVGRVNALRSRKIRGPIKYGLSLVFLPRILASWRRLLPPTQWAHLQHRAPSRARGEVEPLSGFSEQPA